MLDVAEHSAYPRAKCKPRSLIGVFIPNGWFDWIKIRAVFEYFDGLTSTSTILAKNTNW